MKDERGKRKEKRGERREERGRRKEEGGRRKEVREEINKSRHSASALLLWQNDVA
jgi:hypothetical protein